MPGSIRAVVGQRLNCLSAPAQQILAEASVHGQTFRFDDLLAMGEEEDMLEVALEEAGRVSGWW